MICDNHKKCTVVYFPTNNLSLNSALNEQHESIEKEQKSRQPYPLCRPLLSNYYANKHNGLLLLLFDNNVPTAQINTDYKPVSVLWMPTLAQIYTVNQFEYIQHVFV
jgi:hypothetical protein